MQLKVGDKLRLDAYLAWVNCWLSEPWKDSQNLNHAMSMEAMAELFQQENMLKLLNGPLLKRVISSFRQRVDQNQVRLGGKVPPSCLETNIVKQRYDPRTKCSCKGLYPVPNGLAPEQAQRQCQCEAVNKMVSMAELINKKEDEWNPRDLFTAEHLQTAVSELLLCNSDEQPEPTTCQGKMPSLKDLKAPDRRPNPSCDTEDSIYHQLYPTNERVKILSDAKYFFAIACGASHCDEGLAKAVAEAANNILIADYCEAADEESLRLLQDVGAAANAFLKLCTMAGTFTDWQFDNNVAVTMQFCALGYYRDHSRGLRPTGIYGSRMTNILSHRYIDLAIYVGVMNASIGLGQTITREQFHILAEACVYVNDLMDFRSDAVRKLRENVILRGVRGCLCEYLDTMISRCLRQCVVAVRSSPFCALVVMGISNWMLMASQHKVYEVFHGVRERKDIPACEYASLPDDFYGELSDVLTVYGTLGETGPAVSKRRSDMDILYHLYRTSSKTHTAWLADSMRSLLQPQTLRKIIDVVHFEWIGDTGDVEYCP